MATYQYQTGSIPRAGVNSPLNIQPNATMLNSISHLREPTGNTTDRGVTSGQVVWGIEHVGLSIIDQNYSSYNGGQAVEGIWGRQLTGLRVSAKFNAPVAIIAIPVNSNVSGMGIQNDNSYGTEFLDNKYAILKGYSDGYGQFGGYMYMFACMDARPTFKLKGAAINEGTISPTSEYVCNAVTSAIWTGNFGDANVENEPYNPLNLPQITRGTINQVDWDSDSYSYGRYMFISSLRDKMQALNINKEVSYHLKNEYIDFTNKYLFRKRFSDDVMSSFDTMFNEEYADVFSSLHVFQTFSRSDKTIRTPWIYFDRTPNEILDGVTHSQYIMPILGSYITSSFPIFNIQNVEGIYNYFKKGDTSGSENPELQLRDADLRTDWTIYVKGNRNPDILVTMESPGLDEFLADPKKNTKNWTKDNFICEYRVPSFIRRGEPGHPFYTGEYVNRPDLVYNQNNGPFPWLNNVEMGMEIGKTSGPLAEASALSSQRIIELGQEYGIYAQMQFRISYWSPFIKGYKSSWCGYNLGYFGSPSLDEFAPQNNYGSIIQGEFDDGSTVTIIYDELPGDTDDKDKYKPPSIDTDQDITDGSTLPPSGSIDTGLNLLTTSYKMTDATLQELGHDLWSDTFIEKIKLINNSPIENIVGIKIMPVALSGKTEKVIIGNVEMSISGDRIENVPIVDCGSFNFEGYYKSFLDFAPFTSAFLFLPFVGFVEIDSNMFTGHTLNIKYSFDIVMGQCRAMLFTDGIYAESYDAVCAIDVPLVASNRAQIESTSIASMIENPKDLISIANFGGVVSHFAKGSSDTLGFRPVHARRSGGYTSVLSFAETRQIFLVLSIPQSNEPSNYAHTVGLPCSTTWNLSNLSGFTVTSDDVDLRGFSCTDAEKEEIHNLLTSGVYL